MVESSEADEAETAGGYAKEMSEDYKRRQAELVADHIAKQDIVICTALIPGKQAPRLVNEEMVKIHVAWLYRCRFGCGARRQLRVFQAWRNC